MAFIPLPGARPTEYQQGDAIDFAIGVAEQMSEHRIVLADHEGQLKTISGLVTAVQSSLSAWQNVAIGIAGAIGVAIAILAGFQVLSFGEVSSLRADSRGQIDSTNIRIDKVNDRLQNIETAQKTLPAEISQQLLNTAAALSTVRAPQSTPSRPVSRESRP